MDGSFLPPSIALTSVDVGSSPEESVLALSTLEAQITELAGQLNAANYRCRNCWNLPKPLPPPFVDWKIEAWSKSQLKSRNAIPTPASTDSMSSLPTSSYSKGIRPLLVGQVHNAQENIHHRRAGGGEQRLTWVEHCARRAEQADPNADLADIAARVSHEHTTIR